MSKLPKTLEESLNFFLEENCNEYTLYVSQNDKEYNANLNKLHNCINSLLKDRKNQFELNDTIFDYFFELIRIQSMYLYKQGYKDCMKILQSLNN